METMSGLNSSTTCRQSKRKRGEVVRDALRMFEQQQTAIKRLNDAIEEAYVSGFVDELDWDALDRRADQAATGE